MQHLQPWELSTDIWSQAARDAGSSCRALGWARVDRSGGGWTAQRSPFGPVKRTKHNEKHTDHKSLRNETSLYVQI